MNPAERYQVAEMAVRGGTWRAAVPGDYTKSEFPLQYYFEVRGGGAAWLYPGLTPELTGQPYIVVRQQRVSAP